MIYLNNGSQQRANWLPIFVRANVNEDSSEYLLWWLAFWDKLGCAAFQGLGRCQFFLDISPLGRKSWLSWTSTASTLSLSECLRVSSFQTKAFQPFQRQPSALAFHQLMRLNNVCSAAAEGFPSFWPFCSLWKWSTNSTRALTWTELNGQIWLILEKTTNKQTKLKRMTITFYCLYIYIFCLWWK